MADFYSHVPKDYEGNLRYRLDLREKCAKDAGMRRAVRAACKEDVLFFANSMFWLYEPRVRLDANGRRLPKQIPFITWEHQDPAILEIRKNLGLTDVIVLKSRDEGMSWAMLLMAAQDWLFGTGEKIGLVSSTEKKADDPGNMDSLMAKLDWEMTKLPQWITGRMGSGRGDGDWYRNLGDHSLVHVKNHCQINAFAATSDTGRSGRYSWFGLDEHAANEWQKENKDSLVMDATADAADGRLIISTPNGTNGAFYDICHEPSNAVKVIVHWSKNPKKNRGLYRMESGVPTAIDPVNNPLPDDYSPPSKEILDLFSRLRKKGYNLDSGTRSPWYDKRCDRAKATPQSIAKELDLNFGGTMYRIFGDGCIEVAEKLTRPPDITGELSVYEDLTHHFDRTSGGQVNLWCQLDIHNKPPRHRYVVCADVASGEGGEYCSNSAIHVIDINTGEQVLEFVSKSIKPMDWADRAIAIAEWFHGAYLSWEHMGPGAAFTTQVIARGYGYCFEREVMDKFTRKRTKKLGFDNRGAAREALFGDLERAVRTEELTLHSKYLVDELTQYIRDDKGKIRHISSRSDDPTHGDRVIAIGVGVQAMKSRPLGRDADKGSSGDGDPEPGTLAYREWMFSRMNEDAADDWDDRSTADLRSSQSAAYTFN